MSYGSSWTAKAYGLYSTSDAAATVRSAIRVVGDSVHRMQELSESLLALARADVRLTTVPVDLADITRSAITTVQSLGFGDRVVTSQLDESPVDGDPVLLERLAVNLVENAIRHNRDGGAVNIATMTDNGFAVLVVENRRRPDLRCRDYDTVPTVSPPQ